MGRLNIDHNADTNKPHLPLLPEQRKAAGDREGPSIVLGGPGTGKTHTMMARANMLMEAGVAAEHITVITLSDHAAVELQQDLRRLREGNERVDGVFVGTIYAYAVSFLRTLATEQKGNVTFFTMWDADQCRTLLRVITRSENYKAEEFSEHGLTQFLDWQAFNRNRPDDPVIPPPHRSWYRLDREFQQAKAELKTMDFNDLITYSIHTLDAFMDIRDEWRSARTRHLLIDDFQDVSRLQYELLRRMTGPTGSITVFSDPNQSVNSTCAAERNLWSTFLGDFPDAGRHILRIHVRSTNNLVNIIKNVNESHANHRFEPDQQRAIFPDKDKPLLLTHSGPTARLYRSVVDEILYQHEDQKRPLADFAILYPNPSARPMLTIQLAHQRIPYTVMGETGYGETMECKALRAILTLLVNSRDCAALIQATQIDDRWPNSETQDRERRHFHSIIDRSRRTGRDLVTGTRDFLPNLNRRSVLYKRLSYVVDSYQLLSRATNAYTATLGSIAETAYSNMAQYGEYHHAPYPSQPIHEILRQSQTFPQLAGESLMAHIRRFLQQWIVAAHSAESMPIFGHESTDSPGVTLSTFRAAQGRQWETVFIVDCTEDAMGRCLNGWYDDPDDVRRLFYVAMSRAREQLIFCPPSSDGHNTARFPFEMITMLGDPVDHQIN